MSTWLKWLGFSAAVLGVTVSPAWAGRYACEFQRDGNAAHTCNIDSSGTQACVHSFAGSTLQGACVVQGGGDVDLLYCVIGAPNANLTSLAQGLPRDNARNASRALAQKPGFVAGALMIAPAGTAAVAGLYREQQSAPTLAGVCTPN